MEYNKIIAITGLPGLFELIGSKTDGAIVRGLEDQQSRFVASRVHQFSHLESIEVYTVRDNVRLTDVFLAMQGNGQGLPSEKDNKALRSYFENVFPDLDFERVYTSDMKKMVKWYQLLKKHNIDIKHTEEEAEETPAAEEAPVAEEAVEKKPARKSAKKSEAPEEPAGKESKPKKKASK